MSQRNSSPQRARPKRTLLAISVSLGVVIVSGFGILARLRRAEESGDVEQYNSIVSGFVTGGLVTLPILLTIALVSVGNWLPAAIRYRILRWRGAEVIRIASARDDQRSVLQGFWFGAWCLVLDQGVVELWSEFALRPRRVALPPETTVRCETRPVKYASAPMEALAIVVETPDRVLEFFVSSPWSLKPLADDEVREYANRVAACVSTDRDRGGN